MRDTDATQETPSVLTVDEARRALKISHATLYRLLAAGELRSFRVGRSRRIAWSALQEFIDRQQAVEAQA